MNRIIISFAAACGLLVGLGAAVLGQGAVRSLLPMVVDVAQVVPVEAVIVDEDGLTSTVPLTMTVNVQVRLDGVQLASAQVMTPAEPVVQVRSVAPAVAPGDPVVSDVLWAVEGVEHPKILNMGDGDWLQFETRGEWALLRVLLRNVGGNPLNMGSPDYYNQEFKVYLVDGDGRTFAPFDVGYSLDNLCAEVSLNPGIDVPCDIAFEVPKGASDLILRVANNAGDVIDVPVVE